jgi:hypothetical protein
MEKENMVKYISWKNVLSLWVVVLLFAPIAVEDERKAEVSHTILRGIIAFLTAYTVSDIICRYQSQNKPKDH